MKTKTILSYLVSFIFIFGVVNVEAIRKAPYLIYNGNNTQMEVWWQLFSTAGCTLEWGTDADNYTNSVNTQENSNEEDAHQHFFTIENLIHGELYYYQVTVTDEDEEQEYLGSFRANPAADATATKFFVYGDTRSNPGIHDTVATAIIANYEDDPTWQTCVISVGDLVDNGNDETDWDEEFFNPLHANIKNMLATMPYQSCMGNHENDGDGGGALFRKYFPYPYVALEDPDSTHYWSFDYGPALFVYVDQYQADYTQNSIQYNWIDSTLANTDKKWKFIVLHHPGWTAGRHSGEVLVQSNLQPLFEEHGVSFVFGGHNHCYAKAVVNDVYHITTGGGGADLHSQDETDEHVVIFDSSHHYCRVEIVDDILTFEAVDTTGEVFDDVTTHGFKCFKEGWNWLSFPRLIEQGSDNPGIYQQAYYDNGLPGLLWDADDEETSITGFQKILGSRGADLIKIELIGEEFLDNNFNNMLFRHEGYKVKVEDGADPSAIVAAGERLPADYTFPLLYGVQNRGENWMGYFLPETIMCDDAIGNIYWNKVVSIKAQDWCYVNWRGFPDSDNYPSTRKRPLEYGEMYVIEFSEDISNFKWNQNIVAGPVEPFVRLEPQYFAYEEKVDYEVIDVLDIPTDVVEIGVFEDDRCVGAVVTDEDAEQILVYSDRMNRDETVFTFQLVYGRSSSVQLNNYTVYNAEVGDYVKGNIIAGRQDYSAIRFESGEPSDSPQVMRLLGNYPNPFTGETTISFSLTTNLHENARIEIFNIRDQKVDEIAIGKEQASVNWQTTNHASGVYLYKLVVDGKSVDTKKMILLK